LILRYPAGFFEPWSNWSHILENWYLDYEGYLDFSTYVSPPSSYTAPSNFEADSQCLLRHPDYTNVPYVMIETWAKTKGDWGEKGGALGFLFRSPFRTISLYEEHGGVEEGWWYLLYFADSPYILFLDTYQIKCKAYWLESEESWIKLIGETTPFYKPEHANVWNKYRAYINKAGYGVELKLEYWDGNKWLTMASFYHNSNTFHGNYDYYHGVSIPALYMELIDGEWVYRDVRTWIDDTMICKI
ncbi:MAG: hypothetical protein OH338_05545, partial [Candidatus Parvarchaeota archaeon]|nr:hypothetical protein [Candidatus Parvarchaeum tengchongense]